MKSTWFGNKTRYEFAKCLQDADYSNHLFQTMQEFLTAALGAMRQASRLARGQAMDEAIEETVIKAQSRVKKPERLGECLGIMVLGLEEEPHDFLGSVISELGQTDTKFKGQCFTQDALCRLMAEVTLAEAKPTLRKRLMLNEPACGGGATVIGALEILKRKEFMPWHYHWTCIDVDWRMFATCYIQLNLLAVPARVYHGNTLSMQMHDWDDTIMAVMYPPRERDFEYGEPKSKTETKPDPKRIPSASRAQAMLFE